MIEDEDAYLEIDTLMEGFFRQLTSIAEYISEIDEDMTEREAADYAVDWLRLRIQETYPRLQDWECG